jgi:hypothetical protein
MPTRILSRFLPHAEAEALPELLSEKLSGAALNSLLLDVFQRKTSRMTPAEVLRAYRENRFVRPSTAPFFRLQQLKNDLLERAANAGFEPLQLSPACPLGTCSAVGLAHQDKIVSATRGTEVVADATNVLALESALRRSKFTEPNLLHLGATHRHTRTQVFDFEGFTPHFDIFCMTSAGRDTGHFAFEKEALQRHIQFYFEWSKTLPGASNFRLVATPFTAVGSAFCQNSMPGLFADAFPIEVKPLENEGETYYRFLRAKIWLTLGDQTHEIGDGGFTDWTARLLGNRKERFFSSGLGVELLAKFCS